MKLLQIERNVYHTQAKGCFALVMIGFTALFILPGGKGDCRYRFRIGKKAK